MREDPRQEDGAFARLMDEMRACKERRTCPQLTTRALYFEPNPITAEAWTSKGRFLGPIDRRAMFVCESPSNWPGRGESTEPAQCFVHAGKGERFQRILAEHGFADCYLTNSVKCGPRQGKKLHAEAEINACAEFLIREIQLIEPLVVVGVGTQATITLDGFILPRVERRPVLHSIDHFAAYLPEDALRKKWKPQFEELRRIIQGAEGAGEAKGTTQSS